MTVRRSFTFYYVLAFASLPLLSVLVPKVMSFAPVLLGLIGAAYLLRAGADKARFSKSYLVIACGIGALACLSALWADSPGNTLEKGAITALLVLGGAFPLFVAASLDTGELKESAWLIPALLFAAAGLAALELALDLPLYRLIRGIEEGERIKTAVINRGAVNIVLSLFCSLAVLHSLHRCNLPTSGFLLLAAVLILCVATMLLLSQAQIAQLIFVLGLLVYAFYPAGRLPKAIPLVFGGAACVLILSAPWLALWMYAHLAEGTQGFFWLKDGYAASRMEIWDFTSRYALEKPLTGHGLDATRHVESFEHAHRFHREDGVLHPHNFAIQLWVDFGLMGVLPACAALYALFSKAGALLGAGGRAAMATLITTLAVAAISYGLWQGHWIGVMIYLLSLCVLTSRMADLLHSDGQK